jgi:CrcB protein
VVAGGLIGSLIRYLVAGDPGDVPWELLGVNLAGAVLAGWLIGRIRLHAGPAHWLLPFAVVGIAGALTTFSGVVVDLVLLAESSRWSEAAMFASAALITGPIAAGAGLRIGHRS